MIHSSMNRHNGEIAMAMVSVTKSTAMKAMLAHNKEATQYLTAWAVEIQMVMVGQTPQMIGKQHLGVQGMFSQMIDSNG